MRLFRSCLLLFIFLSLAAGDALAQGAPVITGTPPFSVSGGGPVDAIDLGNLNSHITIPIFHKAGRGLPFDFDVTYDTSIWYPVTSNGTTSWQPVPSWGRGASSNLIGYENVSRKITQTCSAAD